MTYTTIVITVVQVLILTKLWVELKAYIETKKDEIIKELTKEIKESSFENFQKQERESNVNNQREY